MIWSNWDVISTQILCALKWKSLADTHNKQSLKSLRFKTVNSLVPEYLSHKFVSINTIQRHNLGGTRHNLLVTPVPNTENLKKSFRYRDEGTLNSLSVDAKQATTLVSFYFASAY